MRRSRLLLLPLLLVFGAACGDDDSGGDGAASSDDPYVEAAVEAIEADEEFPFEGEQAECFARELVGAIGTDNLEEAGVEPEDFAAEDGPDLEELGIELTEEQNQAIADSFGECDISIAELLIAGFASEGEVDEELADCLRENIDEEAFAAAMAGGFAGDEDAASEEFLGMLFGLSDECPGLLGAGG